jgi:hypothetical protein
MLAVLVSGTVTAQEQKPCKIEVTSHKTGDNVGPNAKIIGTATMPPGLYLWVFVRAEGQKKWWPQGGGDAEVKKSGRWVVNGTFGEEGSSKDAGSTFEITAVVVDAQAHKDLTNYVQTSETNRQYPGTLLPAAASNGCALEENITVTRK